MEEAEKKADEATEIIREMLFETIGELGELSEDVCRYIQEDGDINNLKAMHKVAIKSNSLEQFEKQIANLN